MTTMEQDNNEVLVERGASAGLLTSICYAQHAAPHIILEKWLTVPSLQVCAAQRDGPHILQCSTLLILL